MDVIDRSKDAKPTNPNPNPLEELGCLIYKEEICES